MEVSGGVYVVGGHHPAPRALLSCVGGLVCRTLRGGCGNCPMIGQGIRAGVQ